MRHEGASIFDDAAHPLWADAAAVASGNLPAPADFEWLHESQVLVVNYTYILSKWQAAGAGAAGGAGAAAAASSGRLSFLNVALMQIGDLGGPGGGGGRGGGGSAAVIGGAVGGAVGGTLLLGGALAAILIARERRRRQRELEEAEAACKAAGLDTSLAPLAAAAALRRAGSSHGHSTIGAPFLLGASAAAAAGGAPLFGTRFGSDGAGGSGTRATRGSDDTGGSTSASGMGAEGACAWAAAACLLVVHCARSFPLFVSFSHKPCPPPHLNPFRRTPARAQPKLRRRASSCSARAARPWPPAAPAARLARAPPPTRSFWRSRLARAPCESAAPPPALWGSDLYSSLWRACGGPHSCRIACATLKKRRLAHPAASYHLPHANHSSSTAARSTRACGRAPSSPSRRCCCRRA